MGERKFTLPQTVSIESDELADELNRILNTLLEANQRLDRLEGDIQRFSNDLAREQFEEYR